MTELSEINLYRRVMDAIRGKGTKFDHVTVDRLRPGDIVHITGPEPLLCRVGSLPSFGAFSPCFAIDKLPLSDAGKDQDDEPDDTAPHLWAGLRWARMRAWVANNLKPQEAENETQT